MDYEVYTVSGLTAEVKHLIESGFGPVWVEGEIGNFTHHRSGHMYFSLKDASATLRCVFFKPHNLHLTFRPESGMKVLAFGEMSVYEPSGQYQLKVVRMRPFGMGELQMAFEQLKQRLSDEGLFDAGRKRPLPPLPGTVGVVTSATGAAVRDIISVIRRRCPPVRIVLHPVRVQGEGAAGEIAAAIGAFGRWGGADVLVVGRGGGSMEDLWAFNEEQVARAIYDSPVPVISAVGHETDFTIADFVADLRAPTPSAAAEFAVPAADELIAGLRGLAGRLSRAIGEELQRSMQLLDGYERRLSPRRLAERMEHQRRRIEALVRMMISTLRSRLAAEAGRWNSLRQQLSALNPASVLQRGFAVARDSEGQLLRDAADASPGDILELVLARGRLDCRVEKADPQGAPLAARVELPERYVYSRRKQSDRKSDG